MRQTVKRGLMCAVLLMLSVPVFAGTYQEPLLTISKADLDANQNTPKATTLFKTDFKDGFGFWKPQNARIVTSPLDDSKYCRMALERDEGGANISGQPLALGEPAPMNLRFSYRSSVDNSRPHFGTWIFVVWLNSKGESISNDSFPLQRAEIWLDKNISLQPPPKAEKLSIQFRLQQKTGTFDVRDIVLEFTRPDKEKAGDKSGTPSSYTNLEKVVSYTLDTSGDLAVLRADDGAKLPEQKKRQQLPFGFILPEPYRDPSFTYGVEITYEPELDTRADTNSQGLFVLGRNMTGPNTLNSVSLMVWGGKTLFARMMSKNKAHYPQVTKPDISFNAGQRITTGVLFNRSQIELFLNGVSLGSRESFADFLWPKDTPFFIGGEDYGVTPLKGKIISFRLTVYRRHFDLEWEGGAHAGYFRGNGPHIQAILLKGQAPKDILISLYDADGNIINKAVPFQREGQKILVSLPKLPYGWYRLKTSLSGEGLLLSDSRSLVVLPEETISIAAEKSPFGIAQIINLDKESYDPKYVENLFSLMSDIGVRWFRVWLFWSYIQNEPNVFYWNSLDHLVKTAEQNGIELYPCLVGGVKPFHTGIKPPSYSIHSGNYPPRDAWKTYIRTLAERYRGRIGYYQVWNEPDTRGVFYPFTPEAYLELLKVTSGELKSVDPKIIVGLGGFLAALAEPYLTRTVHSPDDAAWGAAEFYNLKPQTYFDITDVHLYPGTVDQSWDSRRQAVETMRKFLKNYGEENKPIWNSETSFISGEPGTRGGWANRNLISEKEQAFRLVQWYALSYAVGVERNFWYIFMDENGGLINTDYSPKPIYAAHVQLVNMLANASFDREIPISKNIDAVRFRTDSGSRVIVWALAGKEQLSVAAKGGDAVIRDLWGNIRQKIPAGEIVLLELDNQPVYISGSEKLEVSALATFKPSGVVTQGLPMEITATLNNPASKPSSFLIRFAKDGKLLAEQHFELGARESIEKTVVLPEAISNPDVGVVVSGGVQNSFTTQLPCSLKRSLILENDRPASGVINSEEQVVVGGSVVDTQNKLVQESRWRGPKDMSAEIAVRRADNRLHFEVRVVDDVIAPAPPKSPLYQHDCIELFFDLASLGQGPFYQVFVSAGGQIQTGHDYPPGFQAETEKTDNGYIVRGSILLPDPLPGHIGFDVAIDDNDGNGRKVQMVWAGDENNHMNPKNYGIVIFKK